MSNKDLIQSGLLELYALDLCSPEEKAKVEAALASDEAVMKEYLEITEALDHLAVEQAIEPPAGLKQSLFERLDGQPVRISAKAGPDSGETRKTPEKAEPIKEESRTPLTVETAGNGVRFWRWLAAAALVLLAGSTVINYFFYDRWQNAEEQVSLLQQDKFLLSDENGILETKVLVMEEKYSFLKKKDLKIATLKGTSNYPSEEALVFWDNSSGEVHLVPGSLSPLKEDQQYQLWAIDNGQPVNAGLIPQKYAEGEALTLGNVSHSQAFAITIEPKGGSSSPTLDKMVVAGNL